MRDFDALATTPAARDALRRLRSAAGAGGPMERHCLRCRHIASEIARLRGWTIDEELLTVAAILHDIGLYPSASRGGVYTADGAALAREILATHCWARPPDSSPGEIYPSYVNVPTAGCWHLTLHWAGHTDWIDLHYNS